MDKKEIEWEKMTDEQKRVELYNRQVKMLRMFLERNAISKEQFDKSYHDLTVKMGMDK